MKRKKQMQEKRHAFAHVRNTWSINPATRIKESKKIYKRHEKHKKGPISMRNDEVLFYLTYLAQ